MIKMSEQELTDYAVSQESHMPTPETSEYKITVIGDRSLRLLILPEEMEHEKKKRKYQAQLIDVGVSQMLKLIGAATENKHSMNGLYIQELEDQVIATDLLKEYGETKGASDILIKDKPDKPRKPLRIEKHLGFKTLRNIRLRETDTGMPGCSKGDKYWVCYDDCFYTEVSTPLINETRTKARLKLWENILPLDNPPTWILWNPRCFGDGKLDEDKGNFAFQDWIFDKGYKERKAKTIVFLRVAGLTAAGIGQRGDNSIDECLQGFIDSFQKDESMKILAGCKAIVIENGVDSAFLIKLDDNGEICHCQVFFRIIRT